MKDYAASWGAESKHETVAVIPKNEHPRLSERLSAVRSQACDCADWLQELAQNYNCTETDGRKYRQDKHTQSLIVYWVRALFDEIRKSAEQFNRQLNAECLMVEYLEPEFHFVECSANDRALAAGKMFYEGHFTTNRFALLLRGVDDEIDAFIVPSDVWLGLAVNSIDDSEYPPFLRMNIDGDKELHARISRDDKAAGEDRQFDSTAIPALAKLLFSKLIEYSFAR